MASEEPAPAILIRHADFTIVVRGDELVFTQFDASGETIIVIDGSQARAVGAALLRFAEAYTE